MRSTSDTPPAPAELDAMRRALRLAASTVGSTGSNPAVGCVLVDTSGAIVATGVHHGPGTPHAEVNALRQAGERARGATAVVTLEPCDHQGRTGPCSRALVEAGIRRVVYAVPDPNPVAAGGARTLRKAGVDVTGRVLEQEGEAVLEMWLTSVRLGRPFVTWKFATTLDGRSAAADGSSRWITCPDSRADAHRLRARHDAVLVGSGTWRADDPHLGLRHGVEGTPPLRVVLAARGGIRPDARLLDGTAPALVVTEPGVPLPGIDEDTTLRLKTDALGRFPPASLLNALGERGIRSVLVEGGPTLAASFLREGLVDRVVAHIAPMLLGAEGRSAVGALGVDAIGAAHRLRITDTARSGDDLRVELRPVRHLHPEGAR